MVSIFRYHEISESSHRIMNPFSLEKLQLLGEICRVGERTRMLDLASGKGEMLCRFAAERGASGVGIDINTPFVAAARARAIELGVSDRVTFVEGDASAPPDLGGPCDFVSCIGATWIGGGLAGTLALMAGLVRPGGWLLVGEPYWAEVPPPHVRENFEIDQDFADLGGTLERFETAGVELVEMVLSSLDDWDRYAASQWLNVSDWLAANLDDPEASGIAEMRDRARRDYLSDERRCLGWGVFVLR